MSELSSAILHVFCKCAEAEEKKRVAGIFDAAFCVKCSEAIEKKEDEQPRLCRVNEDCAKGHPHPLGNSDDYQKKGDAGGGFCMIIKTKRLGIAVNRKGRVQKREGEPWRVEF